MKLEEEVNMLNDQNEQYDILRKQLGQQADSLYLELNLSKKKLTDVETEFIKYKDFAENQDIKKQLDQKIERISSMEQELGLMSKLKGDIFEFQMQNQDLKDEIQILTNKLGSRKKIDQEYNSPQITKNLFNRTSIESDDGSS